MEHERAGNGAAANSEAAAAKSGGSAKQGIHE